MSRLGETCVTCKSRGKDTFSARHDSKQDAPLPEGYRLVGDKRQ